MTGKERRLTRLRDVSTGRYIIVPMDHGLTLGPIPGLEDLARVVEQVAEGGATAILCHRGMVKSALSRIPPTLGLIVHLSGNTAIREGDDRKAILASVEDALLVGADAVSVHINIGSSEDTDTLADLGAVAARCDEWGVPLLAMMYPRGENIVDPFDREIVKHVARIGAECGADIVKTVYPRTQEAFQEVTSSCPVPIVVAGGPKCESDREVLTMVRDAMNAGAQGISIGRNLFQHGDVPAMTEALAMIVRDVTSLEEALGILSEGTEGQ